MRVRLVFGSIIVAAIVDVWRDLVAWLVTVNVAVVAPAATVTDGGKVA